VFINKRFGYSLENIILQVANYRIIDAIHATNKRDIAFFVQVRSGGIKCTNRKFPQYT